MAEQQLIAGPRSMLWPSGVPTGSDLRILMMKSWLSRSLASSKRRRFTFAVRDRYWDDMDWRRSHRRDSRYPEDHLWQAVDGYLDLLDASVNHSQM